MNALYTHYAYPDCILIILQRLFYLSCTLQYELQQKESSLEALRIGLLLDHLCQPQTSEVETNRDPGPAQKEDLNEDRSLNCDYSNDSCMLPKKEVAPLYFIHLGINQVLRRCILTKLLPTIGFPMDGFCQTSRLKSFKPKVFNVFFFFFLTTKTRIHLSLINDIVLLAVKFICPKRFQHWSNKNFLLIHSWRTTVGL